MSQSSAAPTAPEVEVPSIPLARDRPVGALLRPARAPGALLHQRRPGRGLDPVRQRDPRVGPRRTAPARLPLPLSGRHEHHDRTSLPRPRAAGRPPRRLRRLPRRPPGRRAPRRARHRPRGGRPPRRGTDARRRATADERTPTRTKAPSVSRGNQRTWGLLTGTLAVGVALGGLVALVAAAVARPDRSPRRPASRPRSSRWSASSPSALVPFLKYPATPPAVGNPDTIGDRTTEYFAFLLVSVARRRRCAVAARGRGCATRYGGVRRRARRCRGVPRRRRRSPDC